MYARQGTVDSILVYRRKSAKYQASYGARRNFTQGNVYRFAHNVELCFRAINNDQFIHPCQAGNRDWGYRRRVSILRVRVGLPILV